MPNSAVRTCPSVVTTALSVQSTPRRAPAAHVLPSRVDRQPRADPSVRLPRRATGVASGVADVVA